MYFEKIVILLLQFNPNKLLPIMSSYYQGKAYIEEKNYVDRKTLRTTTRMN